MNTAHVHAIGGIRPPGRTRGFCRIQFGASGRHASAYAAKQVLDVTTTSSNATYSRQGTTWPVGRRRQTLGELRTRFAGPVIDCDEDAVRMANFYAHLLGWSVADQGPR